MLFLDGAYHAGRIGRALEREGLLVRDCKPCPSSHRRSRRKCEGSVAPCDVDVPGSIGNAHLITLDRGPKAGPLCNLG
jgi:hypothetical protein